VSGVLGHLSLTVGIPRCPLPHRLFPAVLALSSSSSSSSSRSFSSFNVVTGHSRPVIVVVNASSPQSLSLSRWPPFVHSRFRCSYRPVIVPSLSCSGPHRCHLLPHAPSFHSASSYTRLTCCGVAIISLPLNRCSPFQPHKPRGGSWGWCSGGIGVVIWYEHVVLALSCPSHCNAV
jgi:hypothetical protein